jgi:outer membrane protein, multidrug efflux system
VNRHLPSCVLVILACFCLTACMTVGPDYTAPRLNVPDAWNNRGLSPVYTTDKNGTAQEALWWKHLKDPLLAELIAEAVQSSPDLKSARAKLRAARARQAVATAGNFPAVTASGSASRSQSSKQTGTGAVRELYHAGFDASWELDVFGGTRRGIEASTADLEATRADLRATRISLSAEVATNYVTVRSIQIRLAIACENLASQTETLQIAQWRAQAGLVSSQDVERARSNREQTRAQLPSLAVNLAEAEYRLDILMGKPPGTLHQRLAATGELPTVPERIALKIPADTIRQRPDVMAAERRLAAETARIGVAEAARYPAFKLSGSIGLDALTIGELADSGAGATSLVGNITAPIFNAGRLRQQVEIQTAVREQAQVTYEQAVLTALQDVENALVAFARNRQRSEALSVADKSESNAAQMARQRYIAGLVDFQTVLDTQRSVLSIADSLAASRADTVLALIRLYKALGGSWQPQPAATP